MISQILLAISTLFLTFFFTFENLKFGFYVFIAVLPLLHKETFSLVIWDLLPIRLVLAAIGLVGLGRFIVWWRKNKGFSAVKKFSADPVLITMLVLLVIRLLSLVNTLNIVASLQLLIFYVGIIFFYVFFKFLAERDGYKFLRSAASLYVWVALITGILGIFQFVAQHFFGITIGGVWVVPGHLPRIGSTFWDVNHYGGYLTTVLPISLALAYTAKSSAWRKWWSIVTAFLAVVLLMSQSRSAWLGFAASVVVMLGFMWAWGYRKQVYAVLLTFLIGFLAFFNFLTLQQKTLDRYIGAFMHTRIDSFDTHFTLLSASGEMLIKYPWLGSGYGSFSEHLDETPAAIDFFDKDTRTSTRIPPHSVWGEVIAETGIPGIVAYSFLMIFIFGYSLVAVIKEVDFEKKILQLAMLAASFGILISGIFYSYNVEFFWWTILGSYVLSIVLTPDLKSFSYFLNKVKAVKGFPVFILAITFGILAFVGLNNTHVIDWDEAIYAQVARNIAETGHWLTLQWYKGASWFEKPPLYMWLTAPLIALWGNISLAARFWSAAAGIGGVIVTYLLGSKLFNRLTGFLGAVMLISTVHYLYYSRNGMLDVSVTFFITLAIYLFIRARETGRVLDFAFTGAAVGLAVMTKDIVGLLSLGVIGLFIVLDSFWLGHKKLYGRRQILAGLGLMLLVAVPWHLVMTLKWGKSFWEIYFVDHVFGRAFTDSQGKTQPFLWYLTVIKVSFRIWCLPLLLSIPLIVAKVIKKDWRYLLLAVWFLVIFLFFSSSRSKLIWYIVPIYPVIALFSGRFLERLAYVLTVMYSRVSPNIIRFALASAIFVISVSYVYVIRERVYYWDFNLHIYQLLKVKDEKFGVDRTVFYAELADPAVQYISRGRAVSVTKGNIEEIGSRKEPATFIMTQDTFGYFAREGFDFHEVVEWGGYSLVDKPRTP